MLFRPIILRKNNKQGEKTEFLFLDMKEVAVEKWIQELQ